MDGQRRLNLEPIPAFGSQRPGPTRAPGPRTTDAPGGTRKTPRPSKAPGRPTADHTRQPDRTRSARKRPKADLQNSAGGSGQARRAGRPRPGRSAEPMGGRARPRWGPVPAFGGRRLSSTRALGPKTTAVLGGSRKTPRSSKALGRTDGGPYRPTRLYL